MPLAKRLVALAALVPVACGGDGGGSDGGDAAVPGWRYREIEGATCANGSPWGVATNVAPGASEVVVFLAGGGACWDVETCYVSGAAVHVDEDVPSAVVLDEARGLEGWLFSRDPSVGPFPGASFVYAPYCTGDLHAGRRIAEYVAGGETRTAHHTGAANLDALLASWRELLPDPDRVWLGGISAGGYGAALNWWRFRERFAAADSVVAIDDSGPPIDVPGARFAEWTAAWDLETPPGCADCGDGFSRLLPHYAGVMGPRDRFAFLGHTRDAVIALYYGDSPDAVAAKNDALRSQLVAGDGFAGFFLAGADHVVLADPERTATGGLSAADWIGQLVANDPGWTTVGP